MQRILLLITNKSRQVRKNVKAGVEDESIPVLRRPDRLVTADELEMSNKASDINA